MSNSSPKTGQAALEFLLTYGWAILVVLVAMAALAYFGVLNPKKLLPEKCLLGTGLTCDGFVAESDSSYYPGNAGITVLATNHLGKPIDITAVTIGKCTNTTTGGMRIVPEGLVNITVHTGQTGVTCISSDIGVAENSFDEDIEIAYAEVDSGFTKKNLGELSGIVQ